MLMRGDMQKLNDQINPVFENAFKQIQELRERIVTLEQELKELKAAKEPAKRGPGRPKKQPEAA